MKIKNFIQLATLAAVVMFTAPSCVKEGPMGPAGTDGTNGVDGADGSVTCLACHSGTNLEQKRAQFEMSAHNVGAIAVDYAGGRASCAPCHSHEQFVQYTTSGLPIAGDITNPSAWQCSTCHGIHKTFEAPDYALRIDTVVIPVVASNGAMDLKGSSNLCGTCHQSRSAEPNVAKPGETFALSVRTGPHHGPQGNLLFGNGFAEIPGSVAYPEKGKSAHLTQASCVGCHMSEFTAKQGGHSFIPSMAACNECHEGTDLTDNYNYGGVQTEVHAKLEQLRDKLVELGAMVKTTTDGVDTYAPADKKVVPMVQAQAVFNYFGIEEDRSLGVHNPKYVKALLANTLEALN